MKNNSLPPLLLVNSQRGGGFDTEGHVRKVLLTRADNEIEETGKLLTDAGFDVVPCPLFQVVFPPAEPLSSCRYQSVLITSRNGARACQQAGLDPETSLIAVGEKTAELARQLGFTQVMNAGGDVAALLEAVHKNCRPSGGQLLYARGEIIRQDLKEILERCGFSVDEKILYRLDGLPRLPLPIVALLQGRDLWGALFFSENTARHFRRLIHAEGLGNALQLVYIFGLSSTVLGALEGDGRALLAPPVPEVWALVHLLNMTQNGKKNGQKNSDIEDA